MSYDIKVVGKPRQKHEETSLDTEQKKLKSKVSSLRQDFFPPWVFVVALSLLWGMVMIGSMVVLVVNPVSGSLTAMGIVLVSMFSVLSYKTYSPKWRTIAWAMLLSLALTVLLTQVGDFPGKLLVVAIPTLALVFARSNMNLRKFIESRRALK